MPGADDALAGIVCLADLEMRAREHLDAGAFDYIAGGSWDEITIAENEAAWRRRRLRPRVLVDVSRVDPSTTFLGRPAALPLAIAPTAVHGIAHPDGELATARAAAAAGVPFIHSTSSSRSIEEVAVAAPDADRWFQLYVQEDEAVTRSLVERAAGADYRAIVLTVDLPVLGSRERDRRRGYRLPPYGNFSELPATHGSRRGAGADDAEPDRISSLTWSDLATIRSWSGLPLVLKGIMTAEDGRLAAEHGVDGVVVSNHGGRQLDRVSAPIDVLAEVVAAVDGRTDVWVDGGVRRGLDLAIALALGARGVLVGRPILWALAVDGQAGVERAISILHEEFLTTMRLLGTPTLSDIRPEHLVA